jgi:uncharacterized protein YkwD
MAHRTVTRLGLITAAATVAALSACNPLTSSHVTGQHSKPAPHPVVRPAHAPRPISTVAPSASASASASPSVAPTPTQTPTQAPTGSASATAAYEARILVLVNSARATAGLRPVTASNCADSFAESWAPKIQHDGALSHQSLSPILTACHASTAGENVAYGDVTADEMMTMWMNSPGHRANILNPSYTGIGIGAVTDSSGRWYGVQDFIG